MTKERVSSDVDRKLRIEADAKAEELGISRAKFIEIALKSELGYFNVHKENKRLTEAKAQLEGQVDDLESDQNQLIVQHSDRINEIASALGVPNTLGHIKQRIDELQTAQDELKQEKTELTEQRDEFEKLLHAETDVCNKYDAQVKSLRKERDTFKAAAEEARKQRDTFKAKFEEAESNHRVCSTKLTLLLTRNWWERLWNTLPWVNERLWDTPSRPITPTPDTEVSLPTDKTIE